MIRIGDKVNTNIHPMSIVWVVTGIHVCNDSPSKRLFTELELVHTGRPNVCPHQFNVGDRVVDIETDAVDAIDTVTRTAKGVMYTLENSLKFKYDKDLRPANYTLF